MIAVIKVVKSTHVRLKHMQCEGRHLEPEPESQNNLTVEKGTKLVPIMPGVHRIRTGSHHGVTAMVVSEITPLS